MNYNDDDMMKKLEKFLQSHHIEFLSKYRKDILDLYKEMVLHFDEDTQFSVEYFDTSLTITIIDEIILATKDAPALQDLIHKASSVEIRAKEGKATLALNFPFWKWEGDK